VPTSGVSEKLAKCQALLVVLYAISLPLSLTASWAVLLSGIAVWILQAIVGRRPSPASPALAPSLPPLAAPLGVFAGVVTVSGLVNGGLGEAGKSLESLRALLVYFWAYQVFAGSRLAMVVSVQALLAVGACAGVWGMVQQLFHFHPFGYPYLQGTGFLGSPMAFAGQMQIFGLLALGVLLSGGYGRLRQLLAGRVRFGAVTAANLVGVVFASERGAWLGVIAGIISLAGIYSWRALLKSCLTLAVVSLAAWATIPVVQTRLAPLQHWQEDVSTRVRLFLWRESINRWRQSPILGVGIRRYPHFNIPEAIVPGRSTDINHAHSNYFQILTTTGVVGLAAYLWLWLCALRMALGQAGTAGDSLDRGLALGVFAATVALMVSGAFEYNFGTSQVRLAQWFALALIGNAGGSKRSDA